MTQYSLRIFDGLVDDCVGKRLVEQAKVERVFLAAVRFDWLDAHKKQVAIRVERTLHPTGATYTVDWITLAVMPILVNVELLLML